MLLHNSFLLDFSINIAFLFYLYASHLSHPLLLVLVFIHTLNAECLCTVTVLLHMKNTESLYSDCLPAQRFTVKEPRTSVVDEDDVMMTLEVQVDDTLGVLDDVTAVTT